MKIQTFKVRLQEPRGCGFVARIWTVKPKKDLGCIGETDWETRTIWIDPSYAPEKIEEVLRHEVTHVAAPGLDEDYVLAIELNQTRILREYVKQTEDE